jgi:hypothetical protein
VAGGSVVSFNVLVVPEDPTYNGYILRPLVEHLLSECGKPNSKVKVLDTPRARGYEHAKALIVDEVIEAWAHFNLLLFLPDADGKDKSAEFQYLESKARGRGVQLFCCAAVEEVEAWLLAGHIDKLQPSWSEIRSNTSVKELVFQPFLKTHGDSKRAGGGRDLLMKETLENYAGLIGRCPELSELQARITLSLIEP